METNVNEFVEKVLQYTHEIMQTEEFDYRRNTPQVAYEIFSQQNIDPLTFVSNVMKLFTAYFNMIESGSERKYAVIAFSLIYDYLKMYGFDPIEVTEKIAREMPHKFPPATVLYVKIWSQAIGYKKIQLIKPLPGQKWEDL